MSNNVEFGLGQIITPAQRDPGTSDRGALRSVLFLPSLPSAMLPDELLWYHQIRWQICMFQTSKTIKYGTKEIPTSKRCIRSRSARIQAPPSTHNLRWLCSDVFPAFGGGEKASSRNWRGLDLPPYWRSLNLSDLRYHRSWRVVLHLTTRNTDAR